MYLYDYFFNRETTPTLKAVLAQISRGELPRCAASAYFSTPPVLMTFDLFCDS